MPDAAALVHREEKTSYQELSKSISMFANGIISCGVTRGDRVAVFLNKSKEFVVSVFGASKSGTVFVPVNPILKEKQVDHIIQDSDSTIVVISLQRLSLIKGSIESWDKVKHIVVVGDCVNNEELSKIDKRIISWHAFLKPKAEFYPELCDSNVASLFYTSGSTGNPKGVILTQQNMILGAKSVSSYIKNSSSDNILAILPLSFDAGFSQLTTGFYSGATVTLHDYFNASELIRVVESEMITGITAVPPILIDVFSKENTEGLKGLRYIANTGGHLPRSSVLSITEKCKDADLYLMYGLTEAFRSTYLDPAEIHNRPDSIGKAIPNAEVTIVRESGVECEPGEVGELVHRGPLVSKGYWKLPEETNKRFRIVKGKTGAQSDEVVVFSGDLARKDEQGFIYFVGRKDQLIKTSGYRVSADEIEDVIYKSGLVLETAILGIKDERLGNKLICYAYVEDTADCNFSQNLISFCRRELPHYMIPHELTNISHPLPKNGNGKVDRKALTEYYHTENS